MSRPTSSPTVDSSEPAFKRRRVALACRSCRNRKVRCDGAKPTCKLCIELGFDCVYEQPVKAGGSGLRTGLDGYDERLRAVEQTLQMLVQKGAAAATPCARVSTHNEHARGSSAGVTILDVSPEEQGRDAPVDGLVTVAGLGSSEGTFYGPSSNVVFIRELSTAISARLRSMRSAAGRSGSEEHSLLARAASPQPRDRTTSGTLPGAADIRILPSEKHVMRLIELFFNDTGLLFPFVCKQQVLQAYNAAKVAGFSGVSRPLLCLLNVIFAFATYISIHPGSASKADANDAEVFFQRARQLVHDHQLQSPSLMLIQALLLMCLYRQGSQVVDDPWQLHCLAFRSAMQLGLHSPSFSEGLTALDVEVRKRVWFGCVGIDRILAMSYGRPPAIPESYVKLDLPTDCSLETLSDRHSASHGRSPAGASTASLYIHTTLLYRVLHDILDQMYGFNIDSRQGLSLADMLPTVVALETRMSSLEQNLPPELKLRPWENAFKSTGADPEFSRLSVIMRRRILNVRLLLHRPVLALLLQRRRGVNRAAQEYDMVVDMAQNSVRYCEAAALEIIEIAYALRSRPSMMGAFWFASYYTFNAALTIFACLMLDLDTPFRNTSHERTTADESLHMARLLSSIETKGTALKNALEVAESLGGNTRSGRRIQNTLVKVLKTAQMLCSHDAEISRTLAEALGSSIAVGERNEEQELSSEAAARNPLDEGGASHGANSDSFGMLGFDATQMWNDVNFDDIFGDMMTFDEVGFTAM
ncbi:hypothetical protein CKM354_001008400 [Cercospora kikuchii]|uniref:Zn(2)-C6 fungal-type domain-containing protein n=1 Tax=Cercospora kikuchii TaxID=84275 RepID=A0A9P3FJI8_9PEZI|nr:uncharacterized protein CKM354_001008400 [Cercospora kikuchii]GIZ46982.1 hypothetical protein CKM354_001008400 [Cercospora kikuchii]